MVKSFKDKDSEKIWLREFSKKIPVAIYPAAFRKLWAIDLADHLADLQNPPSNHLEKLKKDRQGQYSIRINRRWRICFFWVDENAYEVEIVDYH